MTVATLDGALYQRSQYWKGELAKATIAFNRWYNDNTMTWGDGLSIISANVKTFRDKAEKAIQNPTQFPTIDRLDAVVSAYIEGIYLQINERLPKWTDPFRETYKDVKNVVKETATFGVAGASFGLVAVAAVYLLLMKR